MSEEFKDSHMYGDHNSMRKISFDELQALGVTKDMMFCMYRHHCGKANGSNTFLVGDNMGYYYDDTNLLAGRHLTFTVANVVIFAHSSYRRDDAEVMAYIANLMKANAVVVDLLVKSQMNVLFTIAEDLGWSKLSDMQLGLVYDPQHKFMLFNGNDLARRVTQGGYSITRENLAIVMPLSLITVTLALAEMIKDRMPTIYKVGPMHVEQYFGIVRHEGGVTGEITTSCGDYSHTLVFHNPDLIDIDKGKATPALDYLLKDLKCR